MHVVLAATHHDADGRLRDQTTRILPVLRQLYAAVVVTVTPQTQPSSVAVLAQDGVVLHRGATNLPTGHLHLGVWRRLALSNALATHPDAHWYHFCDLDRALHWAEFHPAELRYVVTAIPQHDCTVFGRTARAFASHPKVQRDTEAIVNHTLELVSGQVWDVMAASRGLSRQAATLIAEHCSDDTVGSDCSWPLLVRNTPPMTTGYRATEGLEFETLDRYADEVAAIGSRQAWLNRMDSDPQQWAYRLDLARAEVQSALAYARAAS